MLGTTNERVRQINYVDEEWHARVTINHEIKVTINHEDYDDM